MVTAPQRQFWFDSLAARQDVSSNAYRVATLIGFAVFVGKDSCYLSYEVIAERSPFSRRAVIKIVKELEAAGWIAVRRTMGRRANTFMLTLPPPLLFPGANGEQVGSPLDAVERCTGSAVVDANGEQIGSPLELEEQCTSRCTDADEQQCTDVAPTVHELVHPKRRKEIITYNPFDAQPATGGVSCGSSDPSSKQPAKPPKLVFVEHDTEAGRAWERSWLKTKRKRPPWQSMRDQGFRRGWYFQTEFPPDDTT
ncbi:MAG: hypothetical protein H6R00_2474 [Proteobacteria bacterium]|nr:hypothetical protein [Pseudomonadota bacterium]